MRTVVRWGESSPPLWRWPWPNERLPTVRGRAVAVRKALAAGVGDVLAELVKRHREPARAVVVDRHGPADALAARVGETDARQHAVRLVVLVAPGPSARRQVDVAGAPR